MTGFLTWMRGLFRTRVSPDFGRPDPTSAEQPAAEPESVDGEPDGPTGDFGQDHNAFAIELHRELQRQPGNFVVSPFSIRLALAMTFAGARGPTAAQMARALRLPSEGESVHAALAEFVRRLQASGPCEMTVANGLWAAVGEPLREEFVDLVARHYGGRPKTADFAKEAEAVREEINAWVAAATQKRIQDLIPPGTLTADTALALVNAVYFKGTWLEPFVEGATRDEPFFVGKGVPVRAALMRRELRVPYWRGRGWQAVDLPYAGGALSMLVLLPDDADGLGDLERTLSRRRLCECVQELRPTRVMVFLPRFALTWGTRNVAMELAALDMVLPFARGAADFSGINGQLPPSPRSLFITRVLHKALVEVTEQGTVAAAATAVTMERVLAARPRPEQAVVFRADHPFLFAIRERASGAILFLGRLADPTHKA